MLADPEGYPFCVIEPGNNWLAGLDFLAELACDGSRATGLFWSQALAWPLIWDQDDETAVITPSGTAKVAWGGTPTDPREPRDHIRFDLILPDDTDPATEINRLLTLGATRSPDHTLRDPDGFELALLPPR